ncbi:sodium/potassium-transporting ATPase subunit beta-1-interacting protein 3 [Trichinella spiralis]|uniref:sodium/potassium-transporting ATPase subunit beta-1-interacting protein 3 n=1 Tax=Trichinella spiralis TaxID=6334 RepID=UPI0001EFE383|nr:sodium/potassium-transporting ATPase subunit beta-1-interacting protein 3 [Trichinella spiralis]
MDSRKENLFNKVHAIYALFTTSVIVKFNMSKKYKADLHNRQTMRMKRASRTSVTALKVNAELSVSTDTNTNRMSTRT